MGKSKKSKKSKRDKSEKDETTTVKTKESKQKKDKKDKKVLLLLHLYPHSHPNTLVSEYILVPLHFLSDANLSLCNRVNVINLKRMIKANLMWRI